MALLNFIRRALGLDRREHARYRRPPLYVKYHDRRVRAIDWSLGGCLLPPPDTRMRVGDTFEGYISGIGLGNSGDCLAEVVRVTKEGEIGVRWLELDSHVFLVLSGLNIK
ncbi:MAG: PilZ domain-containing protein [Alphaproteobacteria bacterium]|nr:PilZ domain-containing protein [Alphaproteobacteria bacterium]